MIELTGAEIAELTNGDGLVDAEVSGVAIDSRTVQPGDLFVALAGERTDGTRFVDQALAAGAAAALVRRGEEGPGRIAVDDPLEALAVIALEVRLRSQAQVVGITGSTGKTSTKDILAALVAPHATVVASRQNENNELGVPLTVTRMEIATEVAVVEMAMRGIGQIAYLAAIARPQIGIITGIGPVHLELLGTVERVAQAKAELLESLPADGVAIVPHDEPLLAAHLAGLACPVVTFGSGPGADVRLLSFHAGDGGGQAEIELRGRTFQIPVNFTAPHNAVNLTAAAAAFDALGLPLDGLAEGASAVAFSRWRGEELTLAGGGLLIADCYNANPTSMRAALEHLTEVAGGRRRVAVLGEMAELGPDADRYHAEVGEVAARLRIEQIVAVGPRARVYGGSWFATVAEAREALAGLIEPGDAVLVKASRSMGLEALVEAIAP
ncbi:MAG: UDP-N-acetylmuramoyl-tripeptide--D-alanyl-D-alanine ligase [Gaiellales bacterium]|nr:UDP-N-acetylmuramoyl-tripeptide--D-alanyl-D-alanine ligase [Gaiellales bacterium]